MGGLVLAIQITRLRCSLPAIITGAASLIILLAIGLSERDYAYGIKERGFPAPFQQRAVLSPSAHIQVNANAIEKQTDWLALVLDVLFALAISYMIVRGYDYLSKKRTGVVAPPPAGQKPEDQKGGPETPPPAPEGDRGKP